MNNETKPLSPAGAERPPKSRRVVHWRHAVDGNAACGEPNPVMYVSNDAMRGVTCPKCLHVFNDKSRGNLDVFRASSIRDFVASKGGGK